MRAQLIRTLTAELKSLSQESRDLKARIKEKKFNTWREQYELVEVKKTLRALQISLAFLKGIPYSKVERTLKKSVGVDEAMPHLNPLLGNEPVVSGDDRYDLCLEWNAWVEAAIYHTLGQCSMENRFLRYASWHDEIAEDIGIQRARHNLKRLLDCLKIEVTDTVREENTEEVTPC